MINVRLDKKTENVVKEYATTHDISKTMIVREALAMYFSKKELAQNPFELGKDLSFASRSELLTMPFFLGLKLMYDAKSVKKFSNRRFRSSLSVSFLLFCTQYQRYNLISYSSTPLE